MGKVRAKGSFPLLHNGPQTSAPITRRFNREQTTDPSLFPAWAEVGNSAEESGATPQVPLPPSCLDILFDLLKDYEPPRQFLSKSFQPVVVDPSRNQ